MAHCFFCDGWAFYKRKKELEYVSSGFFFDEIRQQIGIFYTDITNCIGAYYPYMEVRNGKTFRQLPEECTQV